MWRQFWARVYYMWGSLHRNFGNKSSFRREHRNAIRRFSRAYELDPTFRRARLDRAIILYREMGLYDEAEADLNALLAEDPAYGLALLNRAVLAQEKGDYSAALNDFHGYLALPDQDEEYRRIATRTVDLLNEIIAELAAGQNHTGLH